jgi:hypothetical protein
MKHIPLNKKTISLLIGGLVVVIGIIILIIALQPAPTPIISTDTPTYDTIVPGGNKKVSWERISPVNSDAVYAYADKISGVSVSVSEQMLPTSFINDTDGQIAQLATAYNATDIVTAGSVKVYIGTSIEGPQSVIFTKNSLLILIKSQTKIQDSAWVKYVESLS